MSDPSFLPTQVAVVANERPELVRPPSEVLVVRTAGDREAVLASTATPTQVANPRRTMVRTIVQLLLAIATALPLIIPIILETWDPEWLVAALAQVLAVQTVIVRIMAIAGVNEWLRTHAPALAAIPSRQVTVS